MRCLLVVLMIPMIDTISLIPVKTKLVQHLNCYQLLTPYRREAVSVLSHYISWCSRSGTKKECGPQPGHLCWVNRDINYLSGASSGARSQASDGQQELTDEVQCMT